MDRPPPGRLPWLLWIVVSTVAAIAAGWGSLLVRQSITGGPAWIQGELVNGGIVADALILSAAQWWVLRRCRLPAEWWIPATIAGALLASAVVIPAVLHLLIAPSQYADRGRLTMAAVTAVGLGDLLLGAFQWLALRRPGRPAAWVWIPATGMGGALGALAATVVSPFLLQPSLFLNVALAATVTGLSRSALQAPVVQRLV